MTDKLIAQIKAGAKRDKNAVSEKHVDDLENRIFDMEVAENRRRKADAAALKAADELAEAIKDAIRYPEEIDDVKADRVDDALDAYYTHGGRAMTDTDPICAKCGQPRSNHPYRHTFVGPTKDETLTQLFAERDRYKARAERAEEALLEIEEMTGEIAKVACTALAQIDAEPAKPRQPTVKPLEWWVSDTDDLVCDTLVGRYQIQKGGARYCMMPAMGIKFQQSTPPSYHKSVEVAKAAAQADYEQRILSALEPGQTDAEPEFGGE